MAKKIGNYKIPFTRRQDGTLDMLEYTSAREGQVATENNSWYMPTEWRENTPFDAELEITGHYRGRSAARVNVKNLANNETYSLGLGAFYEAIKAHGAKRGGVLVGRWMFRKQGANYGLYPVLESH